VGESFDDNVSGMMTFNRKGLAELENTVDDSKIEVVLVKVILTKSENNIRIAKLSATHEEIVEACKKASVHDFIMSLPDGYETQITASLAKRSRAASVSA